MEAPEEVHARATLEQMQQRISHGPHAALGVSEGASASEVRTAFLGLTKQYHPARFARMSPELHRLSNEVFIGIKTAHDALMKQLGSARAQQSGGFPTISAEGTGRVPVQRARGTDRPSQPVIARTPTPTGMPPTKLPQAPRTATEPLRTPTGQIPRVQPRTQTEPIRGGTQPFRAVTPPAARPATPPGTRPATPPATRPPSPPTPQSYNLDTVRHAGLPKEPPFDERAALRESLVLLNEHSWTGARQVLQNLAARVPQSKNYRALLGYARGREAQAAGRIDDASLEYQRALQLDPELAVAKAALAEVQRRR